MTLTRRLSSAPLWLTSGFSARFISSWLLVALGALVAACNPSAPDTPTEAVTHSSITTANFVPEVSSEPWSCPVNPGQAPKGELVAERILAANSTRTEPGLYEGPVWIDDALYFSDFTFSDGFPSRIQRLTGNAQDGYKLTTLVEDSGSNGLAVDADGMLIAGTHNTKSLSRFDPKTGARSMIVGVYNDNVFNSPNDLTEAKDGSVYFTDPDFQRSAAPGGQVTTNVFRVAPDGVVSVVDDTIANPNGISLSPEQNILYVAGGGEQGFVRSYPIVDGVVGAGNNLIDNIIVPDGMAVDCLGNIYVTEHTQQRVRVFTADGEHLATINVDANVTNAAFGGADRKTLYLTGAGAVWSITLNVAGFPY